MRVTCFQIYTGQQSYRTNPIDQEIKCNKLNYLDVRNKPTKSTSLPGVTECGSKATPRLIAYAGIPPLAGATVVEVDVASFNNDSKIYLKEIILWGN